MSASESNTGWSCAQFEPVLSEYREGTLASPLAAQARQHVNECAACAALVEAVAAAQTQLAELREVEPPPGMLAAIMAQTLPHHHGLPYRRAATAPANGWARLWAGVRSPRFAMGVAMSVFAVAVLLNAAQINLRQVFSEGGAAALSPASLTSSISRSVNRAWAHGVAYYHDLRVVYEIEAAIHEMHQNRPAANGSGGGHNRSQSASPDTSELAEGLAPIFYGRTR
ncbi:MAG: hypothetical protein ACRD04_09340 [Terriglobales bacterium]